MLWHISESDYEHTRIEPMDTNEASADIESFRLAIRTLLHILWTNLTGEGSVLLNDFASFARLAMADLAGVVESQAAYTKETLREFDTEVQQGERDNLGRRKKTPEEIEQEREEDTKAKFEKTMDTVKEVGSKAIGVGQDVKITAEDVASRASARLQETYYKVNIFLSFHTSQSLTMACAGL